jgi:hypothetical protein
MGGSVGVWCIYLTHLPPTGSPINHATEDGCEHAVLRSENASASSSDADLRVRYLAEACTPAARNGLKLRRVGVKRRR